MVRTKKRARARAPSPKMPPVSDLLAKAQSLMGEMDFELARGFATRILEIEPAHFEAREMLGIIEAEEGNIDEARAVSTPTCSFYLSHFTCGFKT